MQQILLRLLYSMIQFGLHLCEWGLWRCKKVSLRGEVYTHPNSSFPLKMPCRYIRSIPIMTRPTKTELKAPSSDKVDLPKWLRLSELYVNHLVLLGDLELPTERLMVGRSDHKQNRFHRNKVELILPIDISFGVIRQHLSQPTVRITKFQSETRLENGLFCCCIRHKNCHAGERWMLPGCSVGPNGKARDENYDDPRPPCSRIALSLHSHHSPPIFPT